MRMAHPRLFRVVSKTAHISPLTYDATAQTVLEKRNTPARFQRAGRRARVEELDPEFVKPPAFASQGIPPPVAPGSEVAAPATKLENRIRPKNAPANHRGIFLPRRCAPPAA
jgi:hypothetical protein